MQPKTKARGRSRREADAAVEARLVRVAAIERDARSRGEVVEKDIEGLRALLGDPIPAIAARAALAIIETRCTTRSRPIWSLLSVASTMERRPTRVAS